MHFFTLDESDVIEIHESVIAANELHGLADNKSLASASARLQFENNMMYFISRQVLAYSS